MDKKVSVIVPVYNVSKYLKVCIESILNQTYSYIEVILVNDGSKDNSAEICQEYSQMDKRVKFISQANSGVSSARNAGIKVSTGEYVCFVDGDDILEDDSIEIRIDKINDFDMLLTGYKKIDDTGNMLGQNKDFSDMDMDQKEMIYYLINNIEPIGYQGYLWNKMFKSSIIKNNNIVFDCSISYNEDRLFIAEYLVHCKKIRMVSASSYLYRIRNGSAMSYVGGKECNFNVKCLTELIAFEKIKNIFKVDYYKSYVETARRALYGDLQWYKIIPKDYVKEKKQIKKYMNDNLKICLFDSEKVIPFRQKIKLLAKWFFKT